MAKFSPRSTRFLEENWAIPMGPNVIGSTVSLNDASTIGPPPLQDLQLLAKCLQGAALAGPFVEIT
jgi:hypothetical protein